MKKSLLKPGTALDIVFENEMGNANAHYMKALVYDCDEKRIIISQTSPALNRQFLNRRIMVTFLATVESRVLRFGFPAKLLDLVSVELMAANKIVEAFTISPLAEPKPVDFRLYFRVQPNFESGINLFFKEQKVNVIDISLGGAKFVGPRAYLFRPGDMMKLRLIIDTAVFNLDAVVREVRTAATYGGGITIRYVSIQFLDVGRQMESLLSRAIVKLERQLLSDIK